MINYIVYNNITGAIEHCGNCESISHVHLKQDESLICGIADVNNDYVIDGVVLHLSEAEKAEKDNIRYGYVWDKHSRTSKKIVSDKEINDYNIATVRRKRDSLLTSDVDSISSVRWNSMSTEQQNAWVIYRQLLLDIPQQEGFPNSIIWPTKP